MSEMNIIKQHSKDTGWITAVIEGHWVQAKVYDEPSDYGIDNGRVSKLAVGKSAQRDPNKPFFDQMCFNYDRGLDFDEAPEGVIKKIVAQLDALPKLFDKEVQQHEEKTELNNSNKNRYRI